MRRREEGEKEGVYGEVSLGAADKLGAWGLGQDVVRWEFGMNRGWFKLLYGQGLHHPSSYSNIWDHYNV